MSFRDVGAILRKASLQRNEISQAIDKKEDHSPLSVSAQAYRSFAEGKTPIDVAISLDLTQQEQQNIIGSIGSLTNFSASIKSTKI